MDDTTSLDYGSNQTQPVSNFMDTGSQDLLSTPQPDLTSLNYDFTPREQAQVDLSRKIADATEKANRLNDAKQEAQYPAIEKDIKESGARAQALQDQINQTRQLLTAPAPQLQQNQFSQPEMLANLVGALLNPSQAQNVLAAGQQQSNQRQQIDYQNKLNQFNLNRESAQQLIQFLQQQYTGEQSGEHQSTDLLRRTQVEDQQTTNREAFQSGESQKQRDFNEKQSAWEQFYKSNNEGEVDAAAARLNELDPDHAPSSDAVYHAKQGASIRRQKEALDYYKNTVQRRIDAYQGVIPDKDAASLKDQINSIAKMYDVDPSIFGELPTRAFWTRQYQDTKLQNRKEEVNAKLKFLQQKEKDDLAAKWANIDISKDRIGIAQQNADTNSARLEWQKVKGNSGDIVKSLTKPRQTAAKNLAGVQSSIRAILNGKTRDQVRNDYFKQKDLKPLYKKEAEYEGQLQYLDEQIGKANSAGQEASQSLNPPTTPTNNGGLKPGESRQYSNGISVKRVK